MFSLLKKLTFVGSSKAEEIDPELAYTLSELMDRVGSELYGDEYWKTFSEKIDAKRDPNYRAIVDFKNLPAAWELLKRKTWISLQNINAAKKLTTIAPIEDFPQIERFTIGGNAIEDLSPVSTLVSLREFETTQNRIRDIRPLQACGSLRVLSIGDNPVEDFSPLSTLPLLEELSISSDQLEAFARCRSLPALKHLRVHGDEHPASLLNVPEMPLLRTLDVHNLSSMEGVERFPELLNLTARGTFNSIGPVAALRHLTHVRLTSPEPLDIAPLATLYALRDLSFHCPSLKDVESLDRLPVLHEIGCWDGAETTSGLNTLRSSLSTWDSEFLAPAPRYTPDCTLEVVSQAEFDLYDGKANYGVRPEESDRAMLSSERSWIIGRIQEALTVDLEEDIDFTIPWRGYGRRSETLVLNSLRAYDSFREVVRRVQIILGEAKNDWIIYFQSLVEEGDESLPPGAQDFIVWLYPNKIQTTQEHALTVERLLGYGSR